MPRSRGRAESWKEWSGPEMVAVLQQTMGNSRVSRLVAGRDDTLRRQPAGTPTLFFGARQPAVSLMQHFLMDAGAAIAVDGIYGPQTLHAVRAFQRSADLAVDGIVGPQTWAARDKIHNCPPDEYRLSL